MIEQKGSREFVKNPPCVIQQAELAMVLIEFD
jgi:hypothetical protein